MKKNKLLVPLLIILLIILGCKDFEDFNAGLSIFSCDNPCGSFPTCQSSRGDMMENEKADVQFPFGILYPKEPGSQADAVKSRESVNATLEVTVAGEGTVKVIIKPQSGSTIEETVSKDNPLVITEDFRIRVRKFDQESDRIELSGIEVKPVNGPAQGVQLKMTINECIDDNCTSVSPDCKQ